MLGLLCMLCSLVMQGLRYRRPYLVMLCLLGQHRRACSVDFCRLLSLSCRSEIEIVILLCLLCLLRNLS